MVDERLVNYVRDTLSRGYSIEQVKGAILNAGYSEEAFREALDEAEYRHTGDWKKEVVIIYTIISLTLTYFSIEFIALNLAKNIWIDYLFLSLFSIMSAYFSYYTLKKVVTPSWFNLGYIIPLGVIIDLITNARLKPFWISVPVAIIFFATTYYSFTTSDV